jgi:hypothetical protein
MREGRSKYNHVGNSVICNATDITLSRQAYGSISNPQYLGSGGGNCGPFFGGTGGGKIQIIINGTLDLVDGYFK